MAFAIDLSRRSYLNEELTWGSTDGCLFRLRGCVERGGVGTGDSRAAYFVPSQTASVSKNAAVAPTVRKSVVAQVRVEATHFDGTWANPIPLGGGAT